jgi:hypothetical protein
MNTRVLLLGCLLALSVQAQESKRELWKWKDANGVTQYSDRPVPGATKVELYTSTPAPSAGPAARPATPASQVKPAAGVQYQSLEIWQPESEQTFFGANTTVDVRLRSEPAVASDHELRLFLDGTLVAAGANGNSYTLSNLDRGAHSLEALIVDKDGTVQVRSQPVVFHIMQPTTIEPRAVGPALKPQPPPRPQPKPNSPK